jgi:hypothetical protein
MEKRSSKKQSRKRITDESQFAKAIIDLIIEETESEPQPVKEKDPRAVQRGRQGGTKGGKARAAKLTPERRSEIARKAAQKRWNQRGAS